MTFDSGTHFGPYQILGLEGRGGTGDVYRARDPNLNRDVALKVLPKRFAGTPERLARFRREAQLLASLNHPNIATIHGTAEHDELHALVLELVAGPTLEVFVARGACPLDTATGIARQIVDALEAAHEHGIVHRDLKPSNIKLRPDGVVKVLDFGLAKGLDQTEPADRAASTITVMPDVVVGTPGYMSPEQACGQTVDKRTDIWAFGCILFEMLTGTRAFGGGSAAAAAAAAVLSTEPDWQTLPPDVPPVLRAFLQRCLRTDPKQRLRDIGDMRLALDGGLERAASGIVPLAQPALLTTRRWRWAIAVAGVLIVAGAAVVTWTMTGRPRLGREPTAGALLLRDDVRWKLGCGRDDSRVKSAGHPAPLVRRWRRAGSDAARRNARRVRPSLPGAAPGWQTLSLSGAEHSRRVSRRLSRLARRTGAQAPPGGGRFERGIRPRPRRARLPVLRPRRRAAGAALQSRPQRIDR